MICVFLNKLNFLSNDMFPTRNSLLVKSHKSNWPIRVDLILYKVVQA